MNVDPVKYTISALNDLKMTIFREFKMFSCIIYHTKKAFYQYVMLPWKYNVFAIK